MMKSELKPKSQQLSKRKSFLFKIGAFLFAILILTAFEGALRSLNYGSDYALFIEDPNNTSKLTFNPHVSTKYFSNNDTATSGIPFSFQKEKDPDTFRIFILGASTGIGYPYRYNGGFHNWLEYGLQRSYPRQKFEIINLSLTAINSYTLLDFTKQLVDYEPDAVLIYAGHNEYYGALGVASTNSIGKSPWLVNTYIKLKTLRTTQLIANTVYSFNNKKLNETAANETLMKKMVKDQRIPFDSELYHEGIVQFETNLEDILELLNNNNIPTFLSTIVSNVKDVKPFISDSIGESVSANAFFGKAQETYASNNFDASNKNFIKAKEFDMLRFRAPEKINTCIESLSSKYSNIVLVNSYDAFVKESPHGIIGNELLLEHVHPNVKGYALLGFSFYKALVSSSLLKNEANITFDFKELWDDMPITVLDSVTGNYEVLMLKQGWPYYETMPIIQSDSLSVPELIAGRLAIQKITWDEASQSLFRYYSDAKEDENALKVIEAVALKHPQDASYYEQAGNLAAKLNQSGKTSYLYNMAFSIEPSMEMAKRISRKLIENGFFNEALPYLESIKQEEPDNTFATQLYDISRRIKDLQANESNIKNDADIGIKLAENFILIGNTDKASLYLKTVLKHHPMNEKALKLLDKIS